MLGVGPGERVFRLRRLRLASETPMAIENAVVPLRFLPDWDQFEGSLYDALSRNGHRPMRGLQRLRATLLGGDDAALLGVPPSSPALYIQRIAYLADGILRRIHAVLVSRRHLRFRLRTRAVVVAEEDEEMTDPTFMLREIDEAGEAIARQLAANRTALADIADRLQSARSRVSADHRARQLGPLLALSQISDGSRARRALRFARALDRLALSRAAEVAGRAQRRDFAVGPEPRHCRDAARGQARRRADPRIRQRDRLAARHGSGAAAAARRRPRAFGRRDQIDDRRTCGRRKPGRRMAARSGNDAGLDRASCGLDRRRRRRRRLPSSRVSPPRARCSCSAEASAWRSRSRPR